MDFAVCNGGKQIEVNPGYWWFNQTSEKLQECLNKKACLGGYNDNFTYPTKCAPGYTGYLCSSCTTVNGTRYEKSSSNNCSRCVNPAANVLKIVGFFILILFYIAILIGINLWNKKGSVTSVVFRIMTNYI